MTLPDVFAGKAYPNEVAGAYDIRRLCMPSADEMAKLPVKAEQAMPVERIW